MKKRVSVNIPTLVKCRKIKKLKSNFSKLGTIASDFTLKQLISCCNFLVLNVSKASFEIMWTTFKLCSYLVTLSYTALCKLSMQFLFLSISVMRVLSVFFDLLPFRISSH